MSLFILRENIHIIDVSSYIINLKYHPYFLILSPRSLTVLFWRYRQEVVYLTLPCWIIVRIRKGGRVERRRGKGGRLAVLRVTGMYSKHRQKNAQISPAKCGRLFVFLSLLLLSGTLERASGNTGEQGNEPNGHAVKLLVASTSCLFGHWSIVE